MSADTTTADVLDGVRVDDTLVLVTGGTTGLGLETVRALASAGAQLVVTARDDDKGQRAVDAVGHRATYGIVDLASLASIRAFAADFLARHDHLDVLINNAGVMYTPFEHTADGFELQLGTNHLGHFLLTALLMPALLAAAPSRVVNLSSAGHRSSDVDFDDPMFERRPYDKFASYGQSKTANILFTRELERRFGDRGVHAYAVHPGTIMTELARHMTRDDLVELRARAAAGPSGGLQFKSIEAGAATTVWAAVAPELDGHGGAYLADCEISGDDAPWTRDAAAAARLWDLSEELVTQPFR